jgi:uncharacterized protein YggE
MRKFNATYAAIGFLLMAQQQPLQAQRVSIDAALRKSDQSYVQATGEATVSVKPDQATIQIGIVTQSVTASSVAGQNAKQTDALLAELRTILNGSDQVKTASYSVRPDYRYAKPGAPPSISAYTATNIVEVRVNDITEAGKVIDAVLQSGANSIQRLQFGLKNPQAPRSEALREAAKRAKGSAEAIAAGLGVRVVRVLSAEENDESAEEFGAKKAAPPPPPVPGAPITPVEAGPIEVTVTVTVRVEVVP